MGGNHEQGQTELWEGIRDCESAIHKIARSQGQTGELPINGGEEGNEARPNFMHSVWGELDFIVLLRPDKLISGGNERIGDKKRDKRDNSEQSLCLINWTELSEQSEEDQHWEENPGVECSVHVGG